MNSPSKMPDPGTIKKKCARTIVEANILVPQEYLGNVITLCIGDNVAFRKIMFICWRQVATAYDCRHERSGDGISLINLKSCSRGFGVFGLQLFSL